MKWIDIQYCLDCESEVVCYFGVEQCCCKGEEE